VCLNVLPVQDVLKQGDAIAFENTVVAVREVWNSVGYISLWYMLMMLTCWLETLVP
jgi:hypothetical protein